MGKINQYPECTTPDNSDLFLIKTQEGTKKITKANLLKVVMNLLGNEDISEIADGTVTGAITGLNDDLNKQLRLISSGADVSNYTELYIVTIIGGYKTPHYTTVDIVKDNSGLLWSDNLYVSTNTNFRGTFSISISNNILTTSVSQVYVNGSAATGIMKVYAR